MGVDPGTDDLGAVSALLAQFDAPGESISFSWAFPRYSSFDPTCTTPPARWATHFLVAGSRSMATSRARRRTSRSA